ncbi:MAG: hypothetical protein EPN88_07490 [Bacteroidetes bacterium]|nr:MAG: hypothetical protein EPN88_07490 [Bacteroidota bacterium]
MQYAGKYRNLFRPLIFVALLFLSVSVYPQNHSEEDTIIRISPGTFIHIRDSISFFSGDSLLRLPSSLIPASFSTRDRNLIFFDSLKARASKNPITKKLYDFVIVRPDTINYKRIIGKSDAIYKSFSGKKIRKIDLKRLDVFGSNINNPASAGPNKLENILNKTHVNTNEKIIRKNLLFSEGDLISPLTLSDNERLLRQLPYISDAKIIVVPVSDEEADIVVLTKDVYSLGASYIYEGLKKGSASVFEKNILGIGHDFGLEMPFDSKFRDSPGFGLHYTVDNIAKSFINLNLFYLNGLGQKTYGFSISRKLVSSSTKYAGGISVRQRYTSDDLNKTLPVPQPLKYNLQDYWISRSFLINKEKVSRIIIGARYNNNNVFDRPVILPGSYYYLENYKIFLGSAAFSIQKYYKTNLIYGYGRTEDIPYGGMVRLTAGREFNEFKQRTYVGAEISLGKSSNNLGYFYTSAGLASYFRGVKTEQGILSGSLKYFSNLVTFGRNRIRNFVSIDYTRGFDRYTNEFILLINENGFAGFKNDSLTGNQRFSLSVESVLFSPLNLYGFRFAFFGFTDFSFLSGTNHINGNSYGLSAIGVGIRIRNDNLVFNTFQFRFGYFPNPPQYSKIDHLTVSGEQLLRPNNFDSGPPSIIPYR